MVCVSSEDIVDARVKVYDFGEAFLDWKTVRTYTPLSYSFLPSCFSTKDLDLQSTCGLLDSLFMRFLANVLYLKDSYLTRTMLLLR